jgi:hypothetical protein
VGSNEWPKGYEQHDGECCQQTECDVSELEDEERHGTEGEDPAPQVHDQHGLTVGVAKAEHPVVQVGAVGSERGLSRRQSAYDGKSHVKQRQDE